MFDGIFEPVVNAIKEWFYGVLYKLQASIFAVIDFIKNVFYKLCGLDTVKVDGKDTDLVTNIVTSNNVHRIFLTIMLIGVILLTIFVIVALIRANYQGNEKKGRGAILAKSGQSFLLFLLIPFLLLAGITLVNTIMASINISMQAYQTGGQSTIGGQMLTTIGHDAYKGNWIVGMFKSREEIERMFITGELDYSNLSVVKQYYDITQMNYLVGLLGGLTILIMFVLSSLTFIQRIFDIILLYIISPISVSTIPIDDGNRFKLWKDMLISKILSAYGIILVMNLFFLIIPQVSRMTFFANSFQNGMVYILFLIGGAFAVSKANIVISQLCGSQASGREFAQMIYNFRSGIAFTHAATGAVGAVVGKAVGGSDYIKSRKQGHTKVESLNISLHSNRNQHIVNEEAKKNKAKQVAAMPVRLATMPLGMIKDLMQGGVITAGKNFVPRLKNITVGDSMINRADKKPKTADKAKETVEKTETAANKTTASDTSNSKSTREQDSSTKTGGDENAANT